MIKLVTVFSAILFLALAGLGGSSSEEDGDEPMDAPTNKIWVAQNTLLSNFPDDTLATFMAKHVVDIVSVNYSSKCLTSKCLGAYALRINLQNLTPRAIPQNLFQLPYLTKVTICGNPSGNEALVGKVFASLIQELSMNQNIRELGLEDLNLTGLPGTLEDFVNLETITVTRVSYRVCRSFVKQQNKNQPTNKLVNFIFWLKTVPKLTTVVFKDCNIKMYNLNNNETYVSIGFRSKPSRYCPATIGTVVFDNQNLTFITTTLGYFDSPKLNLTILNYADKRPLDVSLFADKVEELTVDFKNEALWLSSTDIASLVQLKSFAAFNLPKTMLPEFDLFSPNHNRAENISILAKDINWLKMATRAHLPEQINIHTPNGIAALTSNNDSLLIDLAPFTNLAHISDYLNNPGIKKIVHAEVQIDIPAATVSTMITVLQAHCPVLTSLRFIFAHSQPIYLDKNPFSKNHKLRSISFSGIDPVFLSQQFVIINEIELTTHIVTIRHPEPRKP
ncbi:hypothetical protein NEDG_01010 [Nematocida displodere]|uniref:Uncharacterized protein n=1 Tax=Nematocida displodere TaxID=1805483 RepID=A0A177EBJ2_9MICR|nr:hypothetical protein NEDG_01010 [Nematocida displodere]